jgi:hypothetical protein
MSTREFKNICDELRQEIKCDLLIILYNPPKQITDKEEMLRIIKENHDSMLGGHCGISRLIKKLKQKFVWKNMNKMVKRYVNDCDICQKAKINRYTKEQLVITDTPNTAFDTILIDTVGPLRPSNNYRYILTIQCELTKYVEAIPLETKDAKTVAKSIVEKYILKYGCFRKLKTDRGTEFTNELLTNICRLLKIDKVTSTPYHHETIGVLERNHRVLNEYLMTLQAQDYWDELLPYYTFYYNSTPHSITNYSPFELVYGKICTLPSEILKTKDEIYDIDNYLNELKLKLKFANNNAKKHLYDNKVHNKEKQKNVNKSNFRVGDFVYLKVGNRKKLDLPFSGPFRIIEQKGSNSTIIVNGKIQEVHKFKWNENIRWNDWYSRN